MTYSSFTWNEFFFWMKLLLCFQLSIPSLAGLLLQKIGSWKGLKKKIHHKIHTDKVQQIYWAQDSCSLKYMHILNLQLIMNMALPSTILYSEKFEQNYCLAHAYKDCILNTHKTVPANSSQEHMFFKPVSCCKFITRIPQWSSRVSGPRVQSINYPQRYSHNNILNIFLSSLRNIICY